MVQDEDPYSSLSRDLYQTNAACDWLSRRAAVKPIWSRLFSGRRLRLACFLDVGLRIDPCVEQRVGHGKHHRTDEDADQTESEQTADHARENKQQRQVGFVALGDLPAPPMALPAHRWRTSLSLSRGSHSDFSSLSERDGLGEGSRRRREQCTHERDRRSALGRSCGESRNLFSSARASTLRLTLSLDSRNIPP